MIRPAGGSADRERYDVAIVGYGPTGATLANLCGVHGLRAVVLERATDDFPLPRACHLDAEIMRLFQGVGLGDEMERLCEPSRGMEYVDAQRNRVFTFEDFERAPVLGWHEDYVFVQPELDAALRRGVTRFDIDVRLGAEVVDLEQCTDRVVARTSTGEDVHARWLVACDGASSSVRRGLGVGARDLGYDEEWLVVDVMLRRAVPMPTIIQQICDPERLATFVPSAHGHRRWEFEVRPGERADELVEADVVWSLLRPWLSPDDGELVRAAVYRFHALVAERWRVGRVFLAGDAAHQMPPFMGQGMCSGVRDAANLAWKLACVRDADAGDALLDTYETERRPHVERTVEMSVEAGRLLREIANASRTGAAPRLADPDVDDGERWSRLPGLASGVLRGASPHAFPVGHQARQPRVDDGGTVRRLDDLMGGGFALVAAGPVAAPSMPPVHVIDTSTLGDVDGWIARLLAGRFAVLIRPDRYVFGVADTAADVSVLLDDLRRALRPPGDA